MHDRLQNALKNAVFSGLLSFAIGFCVAGLVSWFVPETQDSE